MHKRHLFLLLAALFAMTACSTGLFQPDPTATPLPTATPIPTATPEPTAVPEGYIEGWELVWQDEFEGTEIDLTKWSHEVHGRPANRELQYYTDFPENSFIEDGNLVIQALEEKYIGRNYTSARIRTLGKGDWKYGRFESRMRLPEGQGIWPAFWMLPTAWKYGGWPASGEIDIMEMVGHQPGKVHGTLHYGGLGNRIFTGDDYDLPAGEKFIDDFHVFAVEWEEGEIRWYIDGELVQTQNKWETKNKEFPAPFDEEFHIILNLAVGGQWPGSPDETTVFPQQLVVDYVRVYQRPESSD
ncbi:MAG: family 16 glycosylhydrolase [Anaerolineae bacterium]